MSVIKNYDPNIRRGTHVWEFTFQIWDYTLKVTQSVGGNCRGLSTLESALDSLVDKLYDEQGEYPEIFLTKFNEETQEEDQLEVTLGGDDGYDIEEELKDMLVKAELVSFEENKGI